tara:strand:+ start:148 stop:594 length:447 start_codon:yes stop_codon:yes gene_type:complete
MYAKQSINFIKKTKIMKLKLSKFKIFGNNKIGTLIPFYLSKHFQKFKIKRFFFIHGNNKCLRADHAHYKCNQIFIPVKGSMNVNITTKKGKIFKFLISEKNKKFLFVPNYHWVKIKFAERISSVLVLCDYKYDRKEYIHDFKKFLKKN